MSKYPQTFPTEEAQHLYGFVSTGTLRDNIPHAAHDLWWVGGFLAKYAIGEPDNHGSMGDPAEAIKADLSPEELACLQQLSVLENVTASDLAQPGDDPGGILDNIDFANLLAKAQQVVAFLKLLGLI